MLTIEIPGSVRLTISHLVLDYNGTIAVDGDLLPGVAEKLVQLSELVDIHVITADTFGTVQAKLAGLPCTVQIIPAANQDQAKLTYIEGLGVERVICIGNGRNDVLMLRAAALGIGVIQQEAACTQTMQAADVICTNVLDGFDLLLNPGRLKATLRN